MTGLPKPYYDRDGITIYHGDCREILPLIEPGSIDLVLTSPPYNIGKEYEKTTSIFFYQAFQEVVIGGCADVLRSSGNLCWQVGNIVKDGEVIPIDILLWNYFKEEGLTLRNRIVWTFGHGLHNSKRFSGRHETLLWWTKSNDYVFNLDAVRVPSKYPGKRHYKGPNKGELSGNPLGKNPSDVWDITNVKHNHPEKTSHPCQFPEALADRVVVAMSNRGDIVLDPFMGSGTTLASALKNGRKAIGIELEERYCEIAVKRLQQQVLPLAV